MPQRAERIIRFGIVGGVGLLLLGGALPAYAIGNLHYSADTTITVGNFNLTILTGSDATSLTINDNATVSVTVPADHTLTFTIPAGNSLVTSPTAVEQSCGTPNSLTIPGPNSYIVTPNATQCTKGIAFIAPAPAPAPKPTPVTETKKEEPKTETVTKAPTTPKVFTFEVPKEVKAPAPKASAAQPTPAAQPSAFASAPSAEIVAMIKEEAKELAAVPKKITFDADDKKMLIEARKIGLSIDVSGRGKTVQAAATKANALVHNFLTSESEILEDLNLKERAGVLKEAQYFAGRKLSTEVDIAKALKIAEGIPLSNKELGSRALTAIKRNEAAFCKSGACKGFAVFDAILRGADPGDLTPAQEKKGLILFRQKTRRVADLTNPFHKNLVEAFAVADLSVVKSAPAKKAPAKKAAPKSATKKK